MTILVVGASGATGRLVVEQLLDRGLEVRAVLRSPESLPKDLRNRKGLSIIHAAILDLDAGTLAGHVRGCTGIVSCLGHNLNMKGIFGAPHRLVTAAVVRLCAAVRSNAPAEPVRFVLMNTVAVSNRDLEEKRSIPHRCVIGVLRVVLPPQADNEAAADQLRLHVGQSDTMLEWVAVRPDSLVNEEAVTPYALHASPTRSGVFDPGRSSRINVAHFMAELLTKDETWNAWKGQMPVIYNV